MCKTNECKNIKSDKERLDFIMANACKECFKNFFNNKKQQYDELLSVEEIDKMIENVIDITNINLLNIGDIINTYQAISGVTDYPGYGNMTNVEELEYMLRYIKFYNKIRNNVNIHTNKKFYNV
jgi:hypothetical protein